MLPHALTFWAVFRSAVTPAKSKNYAMLFT